MKKAFFILALILTTQLSFVQQNMDELFQTFGKERQAVRIKLGGFVMGITSLFTETFGVNSVEVISLDECSGSTKKDLEQAIKNLKDPSFETFLSTNDETSRTRILIHIQKDMIKELVVVTMGDTNAMIRLKGNIKPSEIEKVVKEYNNG
ncbi:MAG: DUF4252 domain-containing protein [Tannerellaceae bacterium]|nr:DUF4252 domain-containing protein [Tannerellaceae bacterium]